MYKQNKTCESFSLFQFVVNEKIVKKHLDCLYWHSNVEFLSSWKQQFFLDLFKLYNIY